MSAFRRAIRETPKASATVTMAGRPSGIAATARLIVPRNSSKIGTVRISPSAKTSATIPRQNQSSCRATRSNWRWSGVCSLEAVSSSRAIFPNSVCIPVATTRARPLPRVTAVPRNNMLPRSGSSVSRAQAAGDFATGTDSPVKAASFVSSPASSSRRASAATRSPASTSSRSPGTRTDAGMVAALPSRRTRPLGAVMRFSSATALSARYSWKKPITALSTMIATIAIASTRSPITADTEAARIRIQITRLVNCRAKMVSADVAAACAISLGPCIASRRRASVALSPRTGSAANSAAIASGGSACQSCRAEFFAVSERSFIAQSARIMMDGLRTLD